MALVDAFTSAVLPILGIIAVGYALALTVDVDVEALNDVALYAFLPALIFHSLATTTLGGETMLRVLGAVVVFTAVMITVAAVAGRAVGLDEPYRSVTVLAAAFPNAGFYGIPLAEFAFGPIGRTTAVVYIVAQSLLMYTVGVYVASRGGGRGGRAAVREVFRLPLLYALALAAAARALDVVPPADGAAMATVELVGTASIPLMLVVVGVQLAGVEHTALARVTTPSLLRLVAGPVVGAAVALVVNIGHTDVARVFVLLCATPAALTPLVLVLTYGDAATTEGLSASEYLTTAILVTTLASVPLLTVLIELLRSGAVV